jgi:hypothetical protein
MRSLRRSIRPSPQSLSRANRRPRLGSVAALALALLGHTAHAAVPNVVPNGRFDGWSPFPASEEYEIVGYEPALDLGGPVGSGSLLVMNDFPYGQDDVAATEICIDHPIPAGGYYLGFAARFMPWNGTGIATMLVTTYLLKGGPGDDAVSGGTSKSDLCDGGAGEADFADPSCETAIATP